MERQTSVLLTDAEIDLLIESIKWNIDRLTSKQIETQLAPLEALKIRLKNEKNLIP